jgi:hypothetical protein
VPHVYEARRDTRRQGRRSCTSPEVPTHEPEPSEKSENPEKREILVSVEKVPAS